MLTPERATALWDAGINQFNISLDYLDGRHDAARGIPGLTARIFDTVDGMRSRGIDSIRFNTVIRGDNLDQILPIVHRAASCGCGVNFSLYTDAKNGNRDPLVGADRARELQSVIDELLAYKRRRRGRDHQLGSLSAPDSTLRSGRGARAVPVRDPDDSHRSRWPREAVPGLSDGLSLDGFPRVSAYRVSRLLLCVPRRGPSADAVVAGARRDGVNATGMRGIAMSLAVRGGVAGRRPVPARRGRAAGRRCGTPASAATSPSR